MSENQNKANVITALEEYRGKLTNRDRLDPGMPQVILGGFKLAGISPDHLEVIETFLAKEFDLTQAQVRQKIRRARVVEALGYWPADLEGYVEAYCRRHEVRPTLGNWVRIAPREGTRRDKDGDEFSIVSAEKLAQAEDGDFRLKFQDTLEPRMIDERRLVDRLKIFAEDFSLGFSEAGIDRAWSEWVGRCRSQTLFWLGDRLAADLRDEEFVEAAEYAWGRFLAAILPECPAEVPSGGDVADQSTEVVRAVLAHFVWQVRRKLRGLPVDHHMMPVFIGQQGGGKTEMVKRLLSPLAGDRAWVDSDFAKLTDDRNTELLGTVPVHFLDEMSYASKADIEVTKRKITAEDLTYRPLYGNTQRTIRNIAVFVGCSNHELGHSVADTTGNRRFFPIRVRSRLDWNAINAIDWLTIWRSVDADAPSPIVAVLDRVQAIQEANRTRSQVEEWLDAKWSSLTTTEHAEKMSPASRLYPLFHEFAQMAFRNPLEIKDFRNELRRLAGMPNARVHHDLMAGGNHVFRLGHAVRAGGKPKLDVVQGGKL